MIYWQGIPCIEIAWGQLWGVYAYTTTYKYESTPFFYNRNMFCTKARQTISLSSTEGLTTCISIIHVKKTPHSSVTPHPSSAWDPQEYDARICFHRMPNMMSRDRTHFAFIKYSIKSTFSLILYTLEIFPSARCPLHNHKDVNIIVHNILRPNPA